MVQLSGYFNPRPPRGGRRPVPQPAPPPANISIHAPREGGDDQARETAQQAPVISIHAPREGGDWHHGPPLIGQVQFQSTPPARGATAAPPEPGRYTIYFNPRPPRGGRLAPRAAAHWAGSISIHAPREGGDQIRGRSPQRAQHFNPRPPRGGRPGLTD